MTLSAFWASWTNKAEHVIDYDNCKVHRAKSVLCLVWCDTWDNLGAFLLTKFTSVYACFGVSSPVPYNSKWLSQDQNLKIKMLHLLQYKKILLQFKSLIAYVSVKDYFYVLFWAFNLCPLNGAWKVMERNIKRLANLHRQELIMN